jgi:hypothetical protein
MRLPVLLLAAAVPAPLFAADPPTPGENLFPLAVGNTWTYRVQPFIVPGQPPNYQDDRFVVRVVRQEMVGEQTCFLLEGRLRDRVTATEHVAFTRDGLTRFRSDNYDIKPPVTVLKAGAAAPWVADYQLGERKATGRFRQEIAGAPTRVPAGTFRRATVVHGDVNGTQTTLWYAAGVGMVRQEISEGKRTTRLELEKFDKGQ